MVIRTNETIKDQCLNGFRSSNQTSVKRGIKPSHKNKVKINFTQGHNNNTVKYTEQ